MKNIYFLFLVVCTVSYRITCAQTDSLVNRSPDIHIIELKEVIIGSVQKQNTDRLLQFYKANSSATLEDILSRLPEMNLIRRGPYGMEPSIRSFSGGQLNVLVDGMRIHGACTDKMDPVTIYIEPINLQSLQVQTGNKGFVNGSATGGTLNMKMAEPEFTQNNTLSGIFNSGYQTAAKAIYESALLNYASGRWAFRVSGTYRNNQDYRAGGGDIISFSQFRKTNYSLSAKYQPDDNTYIKADMLADDGWNIGYPALPMDVGYAQARIAAVTIHQKRGPWQLYNWETKVYGNYIQHNMDDTHRPSVAVHMDMPGVSHTIGAYSSGTIQLPKKQNIVLRADASSTYLKASMTMYQQNQPPMYMLTWPDNTRNQYGISASLYLPIDSSLSMQINSRADVISYHLVSTQSKDQVSILGNSSGRMDFLKNISIQVSKKISKKISHAMSAGFSEREPTASELYGFYLFNSHDGYDYIGNPSLKKENTLQADYSINFRTIKNTIQFHAFYSQIFHYILGSRENSLSAMTIDANGVKSFSNVSRAFITGAEATAMLKVFTKTDLISTVRYTYGRLTNSRPLPYIAPLKNITSLRYQSNRYSVQLEYEAAAAQNRINEDAGERNTSGYILLHLRGSYDFLLWQKQVSLQSGIENILDKNYREHLDWGNIPRQGRNLYIQLKFSF